MTNSSVIERYSREADRSVSIHADIIVDNILPFLDRATYDNCVIANKEVWEMSQAASTPPWPQTCFNIESGVSYVAFSTCGQAVVCGCDDGVVYLWTKSGRRTTLKGHGSPISSLAFSPTGDTLVAGCENGFIRIWSLEKLVPTGNESVLKGHEAPVHSLSFIPKTNVLISGGRETSAHLWDLSTKRRISSISHPDKIESITVAPSGDIFASATWEGTVMLWKITDDFELDRMTVLGKGLPLTRVQFSQDGKSLFGLRGFRLRRWDMTDGSLSYLSGSRVHRVFSVTVSPDSRVAAYGDRDGTIRTSLLADALSKACFKDTFYGHHHECSLSFAPDGTTLASGSPDGTFRLWNI
jgi:WD40 repeat protein